MIDFKSASERLAVDPKERAALSAKEGATYIGVGRSTFYELRKSDPTFPQPASIFGRRLYLKNELRQWLLDQFKKQRG